MSFAIRFDGVSVKRRTRTVLEDVTFAVGRTECVALLGANGAGKSTLLWCAAGLLSHDGVIEREGPPPGFVFQNPEDQLFLPSLLDDVSLPLRNSGLAKPAAEARAREVLASVGLGGFEGRESRELSLGERKRAAIALALVRRPPLLLMDEPTAELDGRASRMLSRALRGLGQARLVATHDLDFAGDTADRAVVLYGGRVVFDGPAAVALRDNALLEWWGLR
jgi:cobalt/nickel transport system ATP-binding protein